jgi:hypothetical protein
MEAMMDLNCVNSKSGVLIFFISFILLGTVFTSNNVNADSLNKPDGIAVDKSGNVFVTDFDDDRSAMRS